MTVDILHFAPQAWFARKWLGDRGLKDATVRDYRLGYDAQRNAVVIPYLNALGEVRSYRWRMLNGDIKYMQPKGETVHLFHVKATKKNKVWLCEGEFDAMVLDQAGYPSIGVPGAMSFKDEWAYLFAYCEQVTVVFDGDERGREGAGRLSRVLSPLVTRLRLAKLPEGMDVTDLYLRDQKQLYELIG